jgi:hypothetical protein
MGLEGTELAPDPPQVALGRPHSIHEPAHLGQQRPLLPRRLFGIPRRLGEPLPLGRERDPLIELVTFSGKLMEMCDQLPLGRQVEAGHVHDPSRRMGWDGDVCESVGEEISGRSVQARKWDRFGQSAPQGAAPWLLSVTKPMTVPVTQNSQSHEYT